MKKAFERKEDMRVEKHLFEEKNHKVKVEFRIYENDGMCYKIKTASQLTNKENEIFWKNGETIYHF